MNSYPSYFSVYTTRNVVFSDEKLATIEDSRKFSNVFQNSL